jgi:hypothetical protein
MEVIDANQTTFLPLRYILDNVLLTHETIDWAKKSKQDLIFLKLDFAQTNDKVSWNFLLKIIDMMGFAKEFFTMVKLLFQDAI